MTDVTMRKEPIDRWLVDPMQRFLSHSSMSGMVLFSAALIALILSNSPWSAAFHHFWEIKFSIGFSHWQLSKSLHHWINDGLMALFFFVVGLELKREMISGELSQPRNAILPIVAAIGGMLVPAGLYFILNPSGESAGGWGIPMATDIAFALGILFLLGDRVPVSLKIFLTALAIADDLGAVLVIAFFYTSEIDVPSLLSGLGFLCVLIIGNKIGIRSALFYGIVGIGGVWLAFLLSGVHATIAAVLAAFTIPARVKYDENTYNTKLDALCVGFKNACPNNFPTVTTEQLHILNEIRTISKLALTPLQRLEHALHPLVAFVVMPIFALANTGMTFSSDSLTQLTSPITQGVFLGLLLGKMLGVVGFVALFVKLKWAVLPEDFTGPLLIGAGFLAGVGFTMSLFIAELAFTSQVLVEEAKLGILLASLVSGVLGYFIIKRQVVKS
ncbi:MAG: sodium/proton antiporter NhaA [Desulfobulbaceae bacterium]|jgi:NhaA family Na+:H+ antiporter|nr:MAG: sodium/proton antiporter NhaA [Desulfobulbaceae bacterium]